MRDRCHVETSGDPLQTVRAGKRLSLVARMPVQSALTLGPLIELGTGGRTRQERYGSAKRKQHGILGTGCNQTKCREAESRTTPTKALQFSQS